MIKLITSQAEWQWIKERARPILCEDMCGVVAYARDGSIQGIVAADSFSVDGCNVHIAIDTPAALRAGLLHATADYLFNYRGRQRIFGLVPADNAQALKFDQHIGFVEEKRITNGYATGIDYVVLVMEREQCRWLREDRRAA